MAEERTCAICLETLAEADEACVQPCGHAGFCDPCLLRWLGTQSSRCPLCKQPATAILRSRAASVSAPRELMPVVPEEARRPPQASRDADLACLDHAFFLCETRRLRTFAADQARLLAAGNPLCARRCREVIAELDALAGVLREERCGAFDPAELLAHLYALQARVEHPGDAQPRLYSAEDADQVPPDDESDDEDDSGCGFEGGQRRGPTKRVSVQLIVTTAAAAAAAGQQSSKQQQGQGRKQRQKRSKKQPRRRHQSPPPLPPSLDGDSDGGAIVS